MCSTFITGNLDGIRHEAIYTVDVFFNTEKCFHHIRSTLVLQTLKGLDLEGNTSYFIQNILQDYNIHIRIGKSVSSKINKKLEEPQGFVFRLKPVALHIADT